MLSRLVIAVFYAAVFFSLGAWSGGRLAPIGQLARDGADRAMAYFAPEDTMVPVCVAPDSDTALMPEPAAVTPPTATADLDTARAAFARGELSAAIEAYRAAIRAEPANADALGELGNVYFASGQTGNAAQAYHAAALALLAQDRPQQAAALVPAIRPYAPDLAADLEASLAARAIAAPHDTAAAD